MLLLIQTASTQNQENPRVYLQEALDVLQQVEPTVAAVVLQRDSAGGAPHGVRGEEPGRGPADLPLHLQVAEHSRSR